jgi:hypothetical protein
LAELLDDVGDPRKIPSRLRARLTASSCQVEDDRQLHCTNTANAPLYKSTNLGSGIVNRLRTPSSWFKCWGTGQLHAGGNTTWYFTMGDDNANWGWSPAVALGTTGAFDANPSASGLAKCN